MPAIADAFEVKKQRVLFFDLLRIIVISLVVLMHVLMYTGGPSFTFNVLELYVFSPGGFGVTLFLIVSGCVLEYHKAVFRTMGDVKRFILKRALRIYPAYWVSLVFSIVLNVVYFMALGKNRLGSLTVWDYLLQFSGFQVFTGQWGGVINEVGWFVGLILCLYLLYPLLSRMFDKNLYWTLAFLYVFSIASRLLAQKYLDPEGLYMAAYWSPLSRVFEFRIGIFIVRAGLYPRLPTNWKPIAVLSDMSFYVFLIHLQLLYLFKVNELLFVPTALALAYAFLILDGKIKIRLSRFLAGKMAINTRSST